ncbi:IS1595 family transposase [Edaphocola flava]|uniref:IS1595 family transposase n=1 Tax=Edaphocola flava TaxID=2499629 RepID=UPI00100A84C0|nr:IS1595 family transposase [Edaphocola flava]
MKAFKPLSKFKGIGEIYRYFNTEKKCKDYYEQARWGGNVTCPHCGSENPYRTNRGFKCSNKECHKKFSIISGSIFENTKISLSIWFAVIYKMGIAKKGVNSHELSREIGISQPTAWFLLQRVRTFLSVEIMNVMLNGIIEADETYFGGRVTNMKVNKRTKDSQGRSLTKKPVVGMIERNGKVKAFVTEDTTAKVINPLFKEHVVEGSTVVTDGYTGYVNIQEKYNHKSVKHGKYKFILKEGDNKFHTQNIEGFWSLLKRSYVGIHHYMSPKHLQKYVSEHVYRHNNRKLTKFGLFENSLALAASTRITYNQLIGKS